MASQLDYSDLKIRLEDPGDGAPVVTEVSITNIYAGSSVSKRLKEVSDIHRARLAELKGEAQ